MISVVLLTTRSPYKLASDLTLAGYRVFAALEVSEVLHLCETEDIDAVIISADVEAAPGLAEAQMRRITLRLKPEATVRDVVWELSQLFEAGRVLQ